MTKKKSPKAAKTIDEAAQQRRSAPALSAELAKEWAMHTAEPAAKKSKKQSQILDTLEPQVDDAQLAKDLADSTENAETDAAVDEIVLAESDQLLSDEDARRPPAQPLPNKPKRKHVWRRILVTLILLGLVAVMSVPTTRYVVLNTIGIRSSSSVTVVDTATRLPLKNVTVSVGSKKAVTNSNGVAHLQDLPLGRQTLSIKRTAFASIQQQVIIGWGSNPLGEFWLKATGIQYVLSVKDYISGKPIPDAEATSGEAVAKADKEGIITLTLDQAVAPAIDVLVSAANYRSEQYRIGSNTKTVYAATLVPNVQTIFVGRQAGRLDVQSMYLDGNGRKTILAGTGRENKNIGLITNTAGTLAAVISTRDDVRDDDGILLNTLTVIDIEKGTKQTVSHAEHLQFIDWSGQQLVFVETSPDVTAASSSRYRLMSYDFAANKRTQLAAANQFNSILPVRGSIYYAVASTDPAAAAMYFRVKPDGSDRQTIFDQEVWTALRVDYATLLLQSPGSWHSYTVDGSVSKIAPPPVYQSRRYVPGPPNKSSWIDVKASQSSMHVYDSQTEKTTDIPSVTTATYPLRWLGDDIIVYRVTTEREVADYAVRVSGGPPRKINDVINTYGFSN